MACNSRSLLQDSHKEELESNDNCNTIYQWLLANGATLPKVNILKTKGMMSDALERYTTNNCALGRGGVWERPCSLQAQCALDSDGGNGVFATEDIQPGEVIGTIPPSLIISPRVVDASPIVAGMQAAKTLSAPRDRTRQSRH